MNSKIAPIKIFLFTLCLICTIAIYYLCKPNANSNSTSNVITEINEPFGRNNYNIMQVDTFIYLLKNSYTSFININKTNNLLQLQIVGANANTQDFYNGNDNLLKYSIKDFGFDIKYITNANSIHASFKINNNGVNVPNDVIIKLVDKHFSKTQK